MNYIRNWFLSIGMVLIGVMQSLGQYSISGSVSDLDGNALAGANVSIMESGMNTITDEIGAFYFELDAPGRYTVITFYIAHTSDSKKITISPDQPEGVLDFTLELDPLQLSQIVIIDHGASQSSLTLSQKIASKPVKELLGYSSYGTSDLLSNVPGVFSDASAGEVFSRVYTRGISISAEDDLGWYYVGLEEDGLPIAATQHTYYSPDLFHRADLTTDRLEGINGGKSSVLGHNSPGALFNFKSKSGGFSLKRSALLTLGSEGDFNPTARMDLVFSGPVNHDWNYMVGGFYRKSAGPRDVEIDWSRGGQIKGNISRNSRNARLKIYGKYLNDHTNRWYGLPATNWNNPVPAFGVDFNNSALVLPPVAMELPDGRNGNNSYMYNSDNGIHTKDLAFGLEYQRIIGNWVIGNNFKFSDKEADWQSFIGNQPLGLEGFFPYLLSGISPDFSTLPLGNVVFRDPGSSEVIASVNNFGILGPLEGMPASFEYLSGSLPNDAVMGIAPWKKIDGAQEIMNKLSVTGSFEDHEIYSSFYYARSNVESFTSASFAYATYEPTPRLLSVSLENPGEEVIYLSDNKGISNYGGLLYSSAEATVNQFSFSLGDQWTISDNWILDFGGQYASINQKGSKDNALPLDADNNPATAYNNSFLSKTSTDDFDLQYNNFSWSAGLLHKMTEHSSLYARYTYGNKSPELNYVFNNFEGLPIPGPGETQHIQQAEFGLRSRNANNALAVSGFYSHLSNVAFSEFVFDEETGTLFFTPEQINATTTIGVNIESYLAISRFFRITGKATIQNPEATTFTVYDAAGTGSTDDDTIFDFSGNQIPHNPKLLFEIQPELSLSKNRIFARYRYIGAREGNIENAFTLPAFGKIDMGVDFAYNDNVLVQLVVNNVFNSTGLMNFFGPNEFGSSANAASSDYINQNPNGSFVVFPILPRSIYLKLGFDF